ncbi:hypothetical protein TSOC_010227 [Tetrabaena socialis]|uniref:Uncharacterized protein n=1 Tax=Tetrabaena socialis TaxID=47790 RepID=A0A2J7ZTW4_9CHLO|nr:hypothetical protein TSOC_010227 [Tetrabaena socialis]|eukprot:PNH03704.1 hypothetical protein TSOC_010227 [Tetrabaena socialis]
MLRAEGVAAELDLARERFVAPPPSLPPPPPLPSAADLASAVAALPPPARQLYDSHYALRPPPDEAAPDAEGGAALGWEVERGRVLGALAAAGEGLEAPPDLESWLGDAKKGMLVLPGPLLALLLRFVRVQVSVTPEAAQSQRNRLLALANMVAQQQRRATEAAAQAAAAGGGGTAAAAAEAAQYGAVAAAAREVGEWAAGGGSGGAAGGAVSAALVALLGGPGAQDFASWLQALALNGAEADRFSSRGAQSTQELLSQQQLGADAERYLAMTHDPRLHVQLGALEAPAAASASTASPRPHTPPPTTTTWTGPGLQLGLGGAGEWLQAMRPQLDAYLRATSRRYLDTLLRNPSWNFTQRLQAVQRLIELNAHFLRQPPAAAGGSPFAPLFAPGGPDLVPQLGTAATAASGPQPRQLPDGF